MAHVDNMLVRKVAAEEQHQCARGACGTVEGKEETDMRLVGNCPNRLLGTNFENKQQLRGNRSPRRPINHAPESIREIGLCREVTHGRETCKMSRQRQEPVVVPR